MKKLKNILQYNYVYYILFIISIVITIIGINTEPKSIYNENTKSVRGVVTEYKITDDKITIYLKSQEDIVISYYYKNKKEIDNISYGDEIKVNGTFNKPSNNTVPNLFNYKNYLLSRKIKYTVSAYKMKLVKKNTNIMYKIKLSLLNRINKCKKSKSYLKTFLFADKSEIDEDTFTNYQTLGVSHLFAVSGLHVSFVALILLKIFSKLKEKKRYLIVSLILFIYLFLTNFTISMLRASLQFVLFFLNKLFKLNIKNYNIVIFLFSIILIINPYNIYNVGFLFSFSISFTLIRFNSLLNKGNVLTKSLKTSLISFLVSIPIVINNFFQINFLSIFINIFLVLFVSYVVFPLSIITLVLPFLDSINYLFINILETICSYLSNINLFIFNTAKIPIIFIIIYYVLLYMQFSKVNKKNIIKIVLIILFFMIYKKVLLTNKVIFIDVGQGDSTLIRLSNKNILIDTGGNSNYDLSKNTLIPYFKSEGVNKIDYLILTHGDYDHMGEAIDVVNSIKVKNVILNCGSYNNLEKNLIKVLNKKNIPYYLCISELNISNNKLYFLQTKEYDNENDNSNVIYTEIDGYKFMFMGDAGIDKEKDILEKYNISNIDVLKVGHHGSKTSSSKELVNEINPEYSVISVGKNNRYGHPNKEVLNVLDNSKIYRTDENGSIMFKIKNNKLQIETCAP